MLKSLSCRWKRGKQRFYLFMLFVTPYHTFGKGSLLFSLPYLNLFSDLVYFVNARWARISGPKTADANYGMLRGCAVFHHPRFLQTIHLLSLTVLVLVFSVLTLFALMEHSKLEKIELGATIHASFNEFQPVHVTFERTIAGK